MCSDVQGPASSCRPGQAEPGLDVWKPWTIGSGRGFSCIFSGRATFDGRFNLNNFLKCWYCFFRYCHFPMLEKKTNQGNNVCYEFPVSFIITLSVYKWHPTHGSSRHCSASCLEANTIMQDIGFIYFVIHFVITCWKGHKANWTPHFVQLLIALIVLRHKGTLNLHTPDYPPPSVLSMKFMVMCLLLSLCQEVFIHSLPGTLQNHFYQWVYNSSIPQVHTLRWIWSSHMRTQAIGI
jgi:hypothetical protein